MFKPRYFSTFREASVYAGDLWKSFMDYNHYKAADPWTFDRLEFTEAQGRMVDSMGFDTIEHRHQRYAWVGVDLEDQRIAEAQHEAAKVAPAPSILGIREAVTAAVACDDGDCFHGYFGHEINGEWFRKCDRFDYRLMLADTWDSLGLGNRSPFDFPPRPPLRPLPLASGFIQYADGTCSF